jgi:hypothetical protein
MDLHNVSTMRTIKPLPYSATALKVQKMCIYMEDNELLLLGGCVGCMCLIVTPVWLIVSGG